jgi:HPt (histidine-containing phosphotransfer) domain-containing protein
METGLAIQFTERNATLRPAASDMAIDRAHLARYTMGDAGLEREILELFVNHLPNIIRDLGLAGNDKDWHMAAHALKGSARAVGAWRLARCGETAERLGVTDREAADEVLTQISAAAAEASACVSRIIAGL